MADNNELTRLALELGNRLRSRGERVTTAESCTGGFIAKVITDVAGSSDWFSSSVVTYSNAAKIRLLGVAPELLETVGAVSPQVVQQMAQGAMQLCEAHHAIAVSGIAGPGGGSADKPVGSVWIGWAGSSTHDEKLYHFSGDRDAVRRQAVAMALGGLLQRIG